MNRFFYIIIVFLSFSAKGQAQKATQEALERACTCLGAVPLALEEPINLSIQIDSCLEEGLYVNFSGVLQEQTAQLDNDSSMLALATYLQEKLMRGCVHFRQATKGLATHQLEEVKAQNHYSQGILYHYNTNQQFPIFTLLTRDNTSETFLWLHEFDGSTRFMNGIKPYLYTQVEVVWKEVELYDKVTNRYISHKEVLLIEEKEKIDKKTRKNWVRGYERASKRKD